jgi:hypothetical protein
VARDCAFSTERCIPNGMLIFVRCFSLLNIPVREYHSIVLDAFLTECVDRDCAFSTDPLKKGERCIPNGMLILVRCLSLLNIPVREYRSVM